MKKITQKSANKEFKLKALVATLSALSTMLITSSATQASDIDIYQSAKSGDVTLMFLLDISTSMRSGTVGNNNYGSGACDLPSGTASMGQESHTITRGGVSYTANYCRALETKTYRYRKENSRTRYWQCTNASEDRNTCTWGSQLNTAPSGLSNLYQESANGYTYYYEGMERFYYDRISRLKEAMFDLLDGNTTKGIMPLDDDKVIGLSTLGASQGVGTSGMILMPARALGENVTIGGVTKKHRQLLKERIAGLQAVSVTPTTRSYGESVAYLMGTTSVRAGYTQTNDKNGNGWDVSGFQYSDASTKSGSHYISPSSLPQSESTAQCSGQGIYVLTDGDPNYNNPSEALIKSALGTSGSRFSCTDDTISNGSGWDCTHKLAQAILEPTRNPKNLKFKTAVIGFGNSFNNVPSYDKNRTQAENLAPFINADGSKKNNLSNVQQAAYWGIIGEGGWYSGNSSEDVINSVNDFINALTTEIPSVATGSPVIPKDLLNPISLQSDVYYQQLTPTPDKGSQLWVGNMKKYKLNSAGKIVDKVGGPLLDSTGRLKENLDFWATAVSNNQAIKDADENTYGSLKYAQRGGVWSQLLLRDDTNAKSQRKLLTNRTTAQITGNNLTTLDKTALLTGNYQTDPARGYLLNLLGYNVSLNNITANAVTAAPELRQVGAVIHSEPVLITTKGKTTYNTRTKTYDTVNREDYVLFGTTQGVLHVVEAKTGKEKFAFVPNEMIENQKEAFLRSDITSGGMSKLYYGIDAPWSVYTEYVFDSAGNSTVAQGRGGEEGKQIAYGGLRMGGRSYYALNLQNVNSPNLLFHISPAERKIYSHGSSTAKSFDELKYMGQSWSKPTIAWVNWGGVRKRVMFVGGGYDAGGVDGDARDGSGTKGLYAGYESDTYNQTNKIGAGVYMFDADKGDLLWWSSSNATATSGANTNTGVISLKDDNLKYSVVSEIRTVDRDGDDLIDHLYFGDLGGQVFRIDINNTAATTGSFVKANRRILNLNNAEKSPRFYETPGFSLYNQNGTVFAAIAVGSGNRSAPLKDYTVGTAGYDYDAVYVIYDKDVARKDLYTTTTYYTPTLTRSSLVEIDDGNRFTNTTIRASYASTNGWYYRFKSNKLQSEKVYGMPLAMNNYLYVPTFDGSKPGLAGDCGAGVKGASFVTTFCMPFGQCPANDLLVNSNNKGKEEIGPGIHDITTGGTDGTGGGSGSGGTGGPNGGGGGPLSSQNYCIDTGARQIVTVKGASEGGTADSKICLIPQRWYERIK